MTILQKNNKCDFSQQMTVWHHEERLYGRDVCEAFFAYCYLERQIDRAGRLWGKRRGRDIPWAAIRKWVYLSVPSYLLKKSVGGELT